MFDMASYKASGVDGIQAFFYQKHWSLVGLALCEMVHNFFSSENLEGFINRTKIVLIPKIDRPVVWSHCRPINLCNVTYKIVTKIIANRLKHIMDKVISLMQASFVKGRYITNNIVIIQQLIHYMKRKRGKQGLMAVKVDLKKAYDRLSWDFILDTLRDFGLLEFLVNAVMKCITTASMQIA